MQSSRRHLRGPPDQVLTMNIHDEELYRAIIGVIKSQPKTERILQRYFKDRIIIAWKIEDVHRAANELEVALSEKEAMTVLETLHFQHNAQYGLKWEDLTTNIQDNVLGRKLTKREIKRFVKQDIITIKN